MSLKKQLSTKIPTINRKSINSTTSEGASSSEIRRINVKNKSKRSKSFDEEASTTDEEKIFIASTICQSVFETALDTIYERYLEKQTVYFMSHCSRLAWKALIDWKYQRKDKGGFGEFEKENLDVEPEPSIKDSWAGNSIPMAKEEDKMAKPVLTETMKQPKKKSLSKDDDETPSKKTADEHISFEEERKETVMNARKTLLQTKLRKKTKPKSAVDFSRTKSRLSGRSILDQTRDSHELPPPIPLQPRHFPPSRVEVKYTITPGARGLLPKKAPAIKTIRLHRSNTPERTTLKNDL